MHSGTGYMGLPITFLVFGDSVLVPVQHYKTFVVGSSGVIVVSTFYRYSAFLHCLYF
jgi:hypothetical protein